MTESTRKALAVLPVCLLAFPAGASAVPTQVKLRVEGATQTIFEGDVTTDGHDVTTETSGSHPCDGTNAGAHPTPGPTSTAALDDAARIGGFTWDGQWFDGFEDFQVLRVGPDSASDTQFWGQFLNSEASSTGGCQERIAAGDETLWVFDAFSKQHVLRLSGPSEATTGQAFGVTVVDGQDGAPVSGAEVGGALTGSTGQAQVVFADAGVYKLKADRADSVRSNALTLCVDPPGAEACSSSDRDAPSATVDAPAYASATRGGRFTINWQGDDGPDGSGVASYDVDVRRLDRRNAAWKPLLSRTTGVSWRYGGVPGAAYEFRVRARDRATNVGEHALARTIVPIDNLDPRLRFGKRWRLLKRPGAYRGTVIRTGVPGARLKLAFRGSRVVLIGRRLKRAGRMLVRVDGVGKRIRRHGRPRHRRVLFGTAAPRGNRHVLTVMALGGGPIEIDAIAVVP